jgi:N-acetyl-anhydromuramyl-L-alanine amidase AmpD
VPTHSFRREHPAWLLTLAALVTAGAVIVAMLPRPSKPLPPLQWSDFAPSDPQREWKWIVIHHSGSDHGNTRSIDAEHEKNRGWEGIGYHFVIGNGAPMALGRIEATFRWRLQRHGAHAGVERYNHEGIGICVIGDYDHEPLDPFVEQRLVELCALLIRHMPSFSADDILGHNAVKDTHCPGALVDVEHIRELVRARLARPVDVEPLIAVP